MKIKPAIIYIEAKRKYSEPSKESLTELSNLPEELFMAYSIQYKLEAEKIRDYLLSLGKKIRGFSQVLGCSKLKTPFPILLIGTGNFHALNIALQNSSPLFIYSGTLRQFDRESIKLLEKNKKIALAKFLHSEKIGILVSSKPGQNRLADALNLKKAMASKKQAFIFVSNNLNLAEIENFNLDSWVNTACPGLAYDSPKILNIDDIPESFLK